MRLLTVGELTKHIKGLFDEDEQLANAWVKGEISNFKCASSGHLYFTLKDAVSSIRIVMFRSRAKNLVFKPENGMSVILRGYVAVFERDGVYQLYADEMEPDGLGALYVAFEKLKAKLTNEGYFSANKKSLPMLPSCIGVVTSPDGAALRDIVRVARRRWPGVKIILAPASVQGSLAPKEIADAIRLLNCYQAIDVIIAGRGGGSIEELWAFNTEEVARSIFESEIPVISAVGHETDVTIADMVADRRAATPSAAAEMVVPDKADTMKYLLKLACTLERAILNYLKLYRWRVNRCFESMILKDPSRNIIAPKLQLLDQIEYKLDIYIKNYFEKRTKEFKVAVGRLNALSPLATLARGYSICVSASGGTVLTSGEQVLIGDMVEVWLNKGKLECLVKRKSCLSLTK